MDAKQKKAELALLKTDVVDVVADRIRLFRDSGEIHFPANYSPENALKSAWLILQDTKDKNEEPVLFSCSKDSIANSLLDMVVQGLNPAKKQGYFIAYGKNLTFQRSYFGTIHVIKTVDPTVQEVVADVVYEEDEFEYEKQRGKTVITKHKQKLGNVDKQKIVAAYGTIIYKDGREESLIMTINELKQAWKQSRMKTKPVDENGNINQNSVHGKFTQEMAKKTVINRICKIKINASDDSTLIMDRIKTSAGDVKAVEVEEDISQKANKEPLDIDMETGEIYDVEYREMDDDMPDVEMSDDDIRAMLDAEAEMFGNGSEIDF